MFCRKGLRPRRFCRPSGIFVDRRSQKTPLAHAHAHDHEYMVPGHECPSLCGSLSDLRVTTSPLGEGQAVRAVSCPLLPARRPARGYPPDHQRGPDHTVAVHFACDRSAPLWTVGADRSGFPGSSRPWAKRFQPFFGIAALKPRGRPCRAGPRTAVARSTPLDMYDSLEAALKEHQTAKAS